MKLNKKKVYKALILFLAKCFILYRKIRSKPKYFYTILGAILVAVALIATSVLITNLFGTSDAETAHGSLRQEYVSTPKDTRTQEEIDEDERWSKAVYSMEQDADDALWYGAINVDFEGLWDVNPEIVGWIYFEAAEINYPVLYSGDDEKYLRATYDGKYQTAGSIFLEGRNNSDFSDMHTLIYGHNMRDLTMFGQLKFYKTDADYYDNHQYFQVIYKNAEGELIKDRYHIFACKDVKEDDDIYQLIDHGAVDMSVFAKQIQSGNYLKNAGDVEVGADDQVITLSTCAKGETRFIVSAVKCSECKIK